MAKRKKSGGSLAGLQNKAKSLRKQISDINKKKREKARAAKLARTVSSLQNKLKTARKKVK